MPLSNKDWSEKLPSLHPGQEGQFSCNLKIESSKLDPTQRFSYIKILENVIPSTAAPSPKKDRCYGVGQ